MAAEAPIRDARRQPGILAGGGVRAQLRAPALGQESWTVDDGLPVQALTALVRISSARATATFRQAVRSGLIARYNAKSVT